MSFWFCEENIQLKCMSSIATQSYLSTGDFLFRRDLEESRGKLYFP